MQLSASRLENSHVLEKDYLLVFVVIQTRQCNVFFKYKTSTEYSWNNIIILTRWAWRWVQLCETRLEAGYSCWDPVGFTTSNPRLFSCDQHPDYPEKLNAECRPPYYQYGWESNRKWFWWFEKVVNVGQALNSNLWRLVRLWRDALQDFIRDIIGKYGENVKEETVGQI